MYKYLVSKLQETCQDLDDKFSVNSGGCMYLAYIVAKKLEKLSVPYYVNMWYDENNDPYHVSLSIEGIDINPIDYVLHKEIVSLGMMPSKWLLDFNNANEHFDFLWKRPYKKIVRDTMSNLFRSYAKVVDCVA